MDKTVGDRIRKLRALKDLSQENVAEAIGMSTGNYGKIERGEISISITHLHQISIALDVPITSFFEDVEVVSELNSPYGFVTYKEFLALSEDVKQILKELPPKKKSKR